MPFSDTNEKRFIFLNPGIVPNDNRKGKGITQ